MKRGVWIAMVCLSASSAAHAQLASLPAVPEGDVRFYNIADSDFDPILAGADNQDRRWMAEHYARMQTYNPAFDSELWWYEGAWAYKDSYAIKPEWPVYQQHPEWILRGPNGAKLFIPWGCKAGTCPQYAGDFGNPAFRDWWIKGAQKLIAQGYRGLWIDDVNMTWRVGDGFGTHVTPIDPRTGTLMTLTDWRRYMAEFMTEIRESIPAAEIAHNTIWFAAPPGDPFLQRQVGAADWINLERGINDNGLKGGAGTWGVETFLAFVDYVHSRERSVVMMDYGSTVSQREYGLAGYLLISSGLDLMCSDQLAWTKPSSFWHGYDLKLGKALGARTPWKGLLRRDFEHGIVLLNEPDMPQKTVQLPKPYKNLAGNTVTSVTLGMRQAAVLLEP